MRRTSGILCLFLGGCAAPIVTPSSARPVAVPPPVAQTAPAAPSANAAPVDETFRRAPPPEATIETYVPPPVERARLRNGIPVFLVARTTTLFAIQVVAAREASDLPAAGSETAIVLARAMRDGTTRHSIGDLRDECASNWVQEPEVRVTPDAFTVSASAPTKEVNRAIDLVGEVALRPAFPKEWFARSREQVAAERDREATQPGPIANLGILRRLFGTDPYGSPFASPKQSRAVTREEVVMLHTRVFDPKRLSIVVATDVPAKDVLAKLEEAFGWSKSVPASTARPAVTISNPEGPRIVVIDTPGTSLAFIRQGYATPATKEPDFQAALVAHGVLADARLGRLQHRLRDELGEVPWLTLDALVARRGGYLGWTTQVPAERAGQTLAEIERTTRAFAVEGPTADEVTTVLNRANSSVLADYETAPGSARAYATWLAAGLLPDEAARWTAGVGSLTLDQVKSAAARYLTTDRLRTVVVGDWKALRESLTALGWGPIEVRDVDFSAGGGERKGHASPR